MAVNPSLNAIHIRIKLEGSAIPNLIKEMDFHFLYSPFFLHYSHLRLRRIRHLMYNTFQKAVYYIATRLSLSESRGILQMKISIDLINSGNC